MDKKKKKKEAVWGKQTVMVMLDTSITFAPQSSVFNHDARKWHNSQMNISKKMQLLTKKGNRKVREKNGHLENVAPPQSF